MGARRPLRSRFRAEQDDEGATWPYRAAGQSVWGALSEDGGITTHPIVNRVAVRIPSPRGREGERVFPRLDSNRVFLLQQLELAALHHQHHTHAEVSAGSRVSENENGPITPVCFTLISASLIFSESGAPAASIALATMNRVS